MRNVRHIHASSNEWIRVHRSSGGSGGGGALGALIVGLLVLWFVVWLIIQLLPYILLGIAIWLAFRYPKQTKMILKGAWVVVAAIAMVLFYMTRGGFRLTAKLYAMWRASSAAIPPGTTPAAASATQPWQHGNATPPEGELKSRLHFVNHNQP